MPRSNGHFRSPHGGLGVDPILLNQLIKAVDRFEGRMVVNTPTSLPFFGRRGSMGAEPDARRDYRTECGYPQPGDLTPEFYRDLFDRLGEAERVAEVMSREAWRHKPTVFEAEANKRVTEFEKAWDELDKNLGGDIDESWHKEEKGSRVWDELERADILAGIGSFGVLLIGLSDGEEDLSKPAVPKDGLELTFLQAFDESLVQVLRYEDKVGSRRFGRPVMYKLTFNDPRVQQQAGIGLARADKDVHWTRVIHIADNTLNSKVFGIPRMQPVVDRLLDLRKIYGAAAEGFWQSGLPITSYETHPALGGDVVIDKVSMQSQIQNILHRLQRHIITAGMTAKTVAPTVVDPTAQVDIQVNSICMTLAMPVRVFKGSERGELASSQDEGEWNERVASRALTHNVSRIIVPFTDRLIWLKVLPTPKEYHVDLPGVNALTELERMQVAQIRTDCLQKYIAGGIEALIQPEDYMVNVLEFEEDETKAMLTATEKAIAAEETKTLPGPGGIEFQEGQADRDMERGLEQMEQEQKIAPQMPPGQGPPGKFPPKKGGAGKKPPPFVQNEGVENYDPSQPRHPKGHPEGGQWAKVGGGPQAPSAELWGYQPTAVIRWMGKQGWNLKKARAALEARGVFVADATIKTQLGAGKRGERGDPAPVTDAQQFELEDASRQPPKPRPGPEPQPDPGPSPVVPTPAPPPKRREYSGKMPKTIKRGPVNETEFSRKVWNVIGDEGIQDQYHAREVGKVFREEALQRFPEHKAAHESWLDVNRRFDKIINDPERKAWQAKLNNQYQEFVDLDRQYYAKFSGSAESLASPEAVKLKGIREEAYNKWKTGNVEFNEKYSAMQSMAIGLERSTAKRILSDSTSKVYRQLLREVRQFDDPSVVPDMRSIGKSDFRDLVSQARAEAQELPSDWMAGVKDAMSIRVGSKPRGQFERVFLGGGGDAAVYVSNVDMGKELKATLSHELTHAVESTNPTMAELSRDFLRYRVEKTKDPAGRKYSSINGRRNEKGYKDEFEQEYTGRLYDYDKKTAPYGWGNYTEVMTTGVEGLYYGKYGVATDHEFGDFVVGMLAGS